MAFGSACAFLSLRQQFFGFLRDRCSDCRRGTWLFVRRFGLSLIDSTPQEIAYISLRDFIVWQSSSNVYQKLEVACLDLQVRWH